MEISFTRYRIYRECPWKYKLMFVDGRLIPATAQSSYGLSLHRALESWLAMGDGSSAALLEALRVCWISEGYADPATAVRWRRKAERALTRFQEAESARRSRVVDVEMEFVWVAGPHEVRGMIDRLDQSPDGAYELIDYKTGPRAPTPAEVAADLQLRFYALGARRGLKVTIATLTVDCVSVGARVSAPYDPSGEDALATDVTAAATGIESAAFTPDVRYCPRCAFRDSCAYSVIRG